MWDSLKVLAALSGITATPVTPFIFGTILAIIGGFATTTWYYKGKSDRLSALLARSDLMLEQCHEESILIQKRWRLRFDDYRVHAEAQCEGLRKYYESLPPPPGGDRSYLPTDNGK